MSNPFLEAMNRRDADLYRLNQAEELMREAGFAPDANGHWHPTEDHPSS